MDSGNTNLLPLLLAAVAVGWLLATISNGNWYSFFFGLLMVVSGWLSREVFKRKLAK